MLQLRMQYGPADPIYGGAFGIGIDKDRYAVRYQRYDRQAKLFEKELYARLSLRTFCVSSCTNYDLMVHIVNAKGKAAAEMFAQTYEPMAWPGCEAHEIDTAKPGVVYWE
jgi:hypothetical protein